MLAVPWYEPFGMVALEAMASGRPVVASAVGGMLDTVLDGRTGILVRPKDPKALGRRLEDLLADDQRLAAMGAAGALRASTLYGWDRVAARTAAVYASVCRGTVGARAFPQEAVQ